MRISKKFNMMFYRLILSYLVVIVISISMVGITGYIYFSTNFEKEVSSLNYELLKQLYSNVDKNVFSRISKISVDITMGQYKNADILFFLNNPIKGNHNTVYSVYSYLNELASMNDDIIDSIQIYHNDDRVMVSSTGIKYFDKNGDNKFENPLWFEKFVELNSSSIWITTKKAMPYDSHSNMKQESGQNDDMITFVRAIPPAKNINSVKGLIAINIRESAIYNAVRKVVSDSFGEVFIIDGQGGIISHSNKELIGKDISQEEYLTRIIGTDTIEGNFIDNIEGSKSVITYRIIENTDWRYISIIPVEQLYKKSYLVRDILIVTCLIVLLIGLLVSNIFSVHIYRPLKIVIANLKQLFLSGDVKVKRPLKSNVQEYHVLNEIAGSISLKMNEMEKTLSENAPLIKVSTINNLLYKKIKDEAYIKESFKLIKMELIGQTYYVILTRLDKKAVNSLNFENTQFVKYNIISYIEAFTDSQCIYYSTEISDNTLVTIINSNKSDMKDVIKLAEKIVAYVFNNFNIGTHIGIGCQASSMGCVSLSLKSAENSLKFSYFDPESRIQYIEDIPDTDRTCNMDIIIEDMKKHVNLLDLNAIEKALGVFQNNARTKAYSCKYCFRKLDEMIAVVISYINRMGIKGDGLDEVNLYNQFEKLNDINEFNLWFVSLINKLDKYLLENNKEKNRKIVEKVKAYIKDNICSDISQLNAAEVVGLSTQYFSKLFKETEGINFIEYVTKERMNAAYRILQDSQLKVEEVSTAVGYSNTAYFIRKFKEYYGYTPGNLRSSNHDIPEV